MNSENLNLLKCNEIFCQNCVKQNCVKYDKVNPNEKINQAKKKRVSYFQSYLLKSMITKKVSWNFVIKWVRLPTQDFTEDNRDWLKGKRRKWREKDEERVKNTYHFVLAKWNPKEEIFYIYFEKEKKLEIIKEKSFKINQS